MTASGDTPSRPFGDGIARFLAGNRTGGDVAAPRDAATVILLRDAPRPPGSGPGGGFEVFLVRRAQQIAFMGGAHVFPGGRVDKGDAGIDAAAVREVREETGLAIAPDSLVPWARWVTPEVEPKRFDARFFVTKVPADAAVAPDRGEVTEGIWLAPADALARAERGEIVLPPPTLWNLMELAAFATADDVIVAARAGRDLEPVAPRVLAMEDGSIALVLRGDPCYEDPAARPPREQQRRFVLEDGRWVARRGS
jgi:8-oxo-dGTP pyrophosphatase MutT (NUDIX family)